MFICDPFARPILRTLESQIIERSLSVSDGTDEMFICDPFARPILRTLENQIIERSLSASEGADEMLISLFSSFLYKTGHLPNQEVGSFYLE